MRYMSEAMLRLSARAKADKETRRFRIICGLLGTMIALQAAGLVIGG